MSLAIRALPMAVRGVCALCKTEQDLSSWDSNLGGRVCPECEPFLDAAENALGGRQVRPSLRYARPARPLRRSTFGARAPDFASSSETPGGYVGQAVLEN